MSAVSPTTTIATAGTVTAKDVTSPAPAQVDTVAASDRAGTTPLTSPPTITTSIHPAISTSPPTAATTGAITKAAAAITAADTKVAATITAEVATHRAHTTNISITTAQAETLTHVTDHTLQAPV